VIEVVTGFGNRPHPAHTGSPNSRRTGFSAVTTLANIASARSRDSVHHAVAIIILVVAGLGGGRDLSYAGAPIARGASLYTRPPFTLAAATGSHETLVDVAVTVVVDVVTNFRHGLDFAHARTPNSRRTGLSALSAGPHIAAAGHRQPIVHQIVAVV